jgi:hypothetical protein
MKKLLLGFAFPILFCAHAGAQAQVEVEWVEPSEYRDIRPSNESKKRFEKRTFKAIEKYLMKLAEDLPEGQTLKLSVTDVDLAGRVEFGNSAIVNTGFGFSRLGGAGASNIRIIERIDFPRMTFSYELVDSDGSTMLAGEENLRDLGFQQRVGSRVRNSEALRHEKQMLRGWFDQTFKEHKVALN